MFIRKSFIKNMLDEVKLCRKNAKEVADLGYPKSTPYLSFISDGKEIGVSNRRELLIDFIKQMQYGKYMTLDCGHYVHYFQPQNSSRNGINPDFIRIGAQTMFWEDEGQFTGEISPAMLCAMGIHFVMVGIVREDSPLERAIWRKDIV